MENILRRHSGFLNAHGYEVRDVIHRAVIKALEKEDAWDRSQSFEKWFKTIAYNTIKDLFRRAAINTRHSGGEYDDETIPDSSNPIRQLEKRDELEKVRAKISRLKPEYQQALEHVQEGLDQKDVANKLGITENNAKLRLFHARQALKKLDDAA